MSFGDVFKKGFLEAFRTTEGQVSTNAVFYLLLTGVIALYIFFVYRLVMRRTFYNKNMNIALALIAIITSAVILAVQSNIVLSLGMVGALSIVRFRTAIKDPMDLVFFFWSISVGIICGAGLIGLALVTSILLTVFVFLLDRLPVNKVTMMLVVNADDIGAEEQIVGVVNKYSKRHKIKSRNYSKQHLDMVIEVKITDEQACMKEVLALPGITTAALLAHDGEVTF